MLAHIDTAAAAGRARLQAQIDHGTTRIATTAAAQHAAVTAAGAAQKTKVRASFAQARTDVASSAVQAQGTIAAHGAAHGAALDRWHVNAVATANATFARGQAHARKAGDDGAQKATTAANDAAAKVDGKIQSSSHQALAIGEQKASAGGAPEVADAKAKAAGKISGDASQKIGNLGHLAGDLRAMAASTASGLRQRGDEAARAIGACGPQVTAQYGAVHASTSRAISALTGKGRQSADQIKTQATASLHTQEQHTIAGLDQQTAKSAAELKIAGSHASAAYRKHGADAIHASHQALGALKQKVAAHPIDAQQAPVTGTHATAEIQRGFDGIEIRTQAPADQATTHIGAAGAQTVGALGKVHGQVQPQIGGVVDHARGGAAKLTGDLGTKLEGAVTGARGAGTQMHTRVTAGIDDQVGQVDKAVSKGVGDLQSGLDAKVSEADRKAQEPLTQVAPKIDQAHAKIDADAHKSTLGKVLSWVGDQLKQLGHMLLDPGFWVGLLVAVVLIAFLPEELAGLALIGAMAVIGALAAGIGTMVSNLAAGRPVLQNVLQNMLIGALFGGALTVVGAALGTGPAGIAAMMGTAGGLTVITNLVTGRPWDEGLLANVLLVGVFAGIAKLFGRPGSIKSAKEPKPGEVPEPEPEPLPEPKNTTGLPPDLQAIYDTLTPKAQAQFDARWGRIARDPAHPTAADIERMKAYLDAVQRKGGGDYSKGLEADYDKAHPQPGKATGEAADQLPGLRAKGEALRARIEAARDAAPRGTGYESMLKDLNGELKPKGPLARLESGDVTATEQAVQDVRSNIEGVEAEFQVAQSESGVIGVGKQKQGGGEIADVDVEAGDGRRWVEVKNTEPFSTDSTDWKGSPPKPGKPGKQGLDAQSDKLLRVAHDPENFVDGKPPEVVIRFTKGVSPDVAAALRANGIKVIGTERPPVPPPPGNQDGRDDHD